MQLYDLARPDEHRLGLSERDTLRCVAPLHRPCRVIYGFRGRNTVRRTVRVLRQRGIAENPGLPERMADLLYAVRVVALNGAECGPAFVKLHHDPDMIRRAVTVIVKKYDIALRQGIAVASVQTRIGQRHAPRRAVGSVRNGSLRDSGIAQAEGDKHRVPVTVRLPVPLAIAGNALHSAVVGHKVVFRAFLVAELCLRNGDHIVGPDARQLNAGNTALPSGRILKVRVRVGVAGKGVLVLFLLAHELFLVARVGMDMQCFFRRSRFLLSADQDGFLLIAGLRVRMALGFLLLAGQIPLRVIAGIAVRMPFGFLQAADRDLLYFITCIRVRMDSRRLFRRFGFLLPADQHPFIALVRMLMGLLAAKGIARHGKRREDQRIGRTEHDDTCQYGHDLLPMFFAQMLF